MDCPECLKGVITETQYKPVEKNRAGTVIAPRKIVHTCKECGTVIPPLKKPSEVVTPEVEKVVEKVEVEVAEKGSN